MSSIEARIKQKRDALWALADAIRAAEALDQWFTHDRAREPEVSRKLIEMGLLDIFRGRAALAAKQLDSLHELLDDLVEPEE